LAPFCLRYSRQRQNGSSGDVQYQETTCTTITVVIQDAVVCADALAAQSETRVQRRSTRCLVADRRRCIVAGPVPGSSPVDHSDQIARSALSYSVPLDPVTERFAMQTNGCASVRHVLYHKLTKLELKAIENHK